MCCTVLCVNKIKSASLIDGKIISSSHVWIFCHLLNVCCNFHSSQNLKQIIHTIYVISSCIFQHHNLQFIHKQTYSTVSIHGISCRCTYDFPIMYPKPKHRTQSQYSTVVNINMYCIVRKNRIKKCWWWDEILGFCTYMYIHTFTANHLLLMK
jgi:hypothetical protein